MLASVSRDTSPRLSRAPSATGCAWRFAHDPGKPFLPRGSKVIEYFPNWPEARARLAQIRAAGYHGQAVDMGVEIRLVIDGGKRGLPLDKLPKGESQ